MKFTHVNTLPANNFIESILTLSHIGISHRTTHTSIYWLGRRRHRWCNVVMFAIGTKIRLIIKHEIHIHNMRLFWTLVILQRFSIKFAWLHFENPHDFIEMRGIKSIHWQFTCVARCWKSNPPIFIYILSWPRCSLSLPSQHYRHTTFFPFELGHFSIYFYDIYQVNFVIDTSIAPKRSHSQPIHGPPLSNHLEWFQSQLHT